jgi:hypothetical protein
MEMSVQISEWPAVRSSFFIVPAQATHADQIVAECRDLIALHALDVEKARDVVLNAMLGDQPLSLKTDARRTDLSQDDISPS